MSTILYVAANIFGMAPPVDPVRWTGAGKLARRDAMLVTAIGSPAAEHAMLVAVTRGPAARGPHEAAAVGSRAARDRHEATCIRYSAAGEAMLAAAGAFRARKPRSNARGSGAKSPRIGPLYPVGLQKCWSN